MIIEFTGPSGAGKSVYASAFMDLLSQRNVNIMCIHDAASKQASEIPEVFSIAGRHNWKTDLRALPVAMLLFLRHYYQVQPRQGFVTVFLGKFCKMLGFFGI